MPRVKARPARQYHLPSYITLYTLHIYYVVCTQAWTVYLLKEYRLVRILSWVLKEVFLTKRLPSFLARLSSLSATVPYTPSSCLQFILNSCAYVWTVCCSIQCTMQCTLLCKKAREAYRVLGDFCLNVSL